MAEIHEPEPTPAEIHAALGVLSRAGWQIRIAEAYGILSDLGPPYGTIVQLAYKPHPAAKHYVRGTAQEPWKEKL